MSSRAYALNMARQWVAQVCDDLEDVIYEYQSDPNAPRPALPYATVWIETSTPQSATPYIVTTITAGVVNVDWVQEEHSLARTGTLRVRLFGDGSLERIELLQASLAWPATLQLLRGEIATYPERVVTIGSLLASMDLRVIRQTVREPTAMADFEISWIQIATTEVPWIETAACDPTIT